MKKWSIEKIEENKGEWHVTLKNHPTIRGFFGPLPEGDWTDELSIYKTMPEILAGAAASFQSLGPTKFNSIGAELEETDE